MRTINFHCSSIYDNKYIQYIQQRVICWTKFKFIGHQQWLNRHSGYTSPFHSICLERLFFFNWHHVYSGSTISVHPMPILINGHETTASSSLMSSLDFIIQIAGAEEMQTHSEYLRKSSKAERKFEIYLKK